MIENDLEARLKLIVKAAPDLRKAGVTSVAIGDIKFELAPDQPGEVIPANTAPPDDPHDPLKDPELYGGEVPRRRGSPVPDEDTESWPNKSAGGKPPRAKHTS